MRLSRDIGPVVVVLAMIVGLGRAQQLAASGPDPSEVQLGREAIVKLSVDVARADATLGPLPKIDGLEVAGGPPVESKRAGATTTSWTLRLSPRRAGAFEIPPFLVDAGGRTLKTEPMRLEVTDDPTGARYAFVETVTPRTEYWLREPIPVVVRFGFDAKFLAENVSQLFRQELDVPAQLRAPWLDKLDGAVVRMPDGAGDRRSFVLNDAVSAATVAGERVVDGRTFTVLEVTRTYVAEAAGELVIPEPLLRFAFATSFRQDFISGRVPTDRHEAFVAGGRLVVDVRALPDTDRPAGFSGGVGRFTVRAEASRREVDAGDTMQIVLTIGGDGDLKGVRAPTLEPLPGFHVQGMIKGEQDGRPTFTYDVVPLNGSVVRVPPIPFTYFDPGPPGGYRTVRTDPIPLVVHGEPGEVPDMPTPEVVETRAVAGVDDIYGLKTSSLRSDSRQRIAPALVLGVLVLPAALAGILFAWVRTRDRDRRDPDGVRSRRAMAAFQSATSRSDADMREALAAYLAARLRCPTPAVIAPGLDDRLRAAGVAPELAVRAARALEGLVAEHYGSPSPGSGGDLQGLVGEVERSFASRRRKA